MTLARYLVCAAPGGSSAALRLRPESREHGSRLLSELFGCGASELLAETSEVRIDERCVPIFLRCSVRPFNLGEPEPSDRLVIRGAELVEHVIHPSGYLSGESFVAFFACLDIDESYAFSVCSPFHPLQERAASFYVHMAGAFPRRMAGLIYRVSTQVAGDGVANTKHRQMPLR